MSSISSPKVSVNRQVQSQRWYNFYAMFSEQFAFDAIRRMALRKTAILMDPWLGSGTTTSVSSKLGYKAHGFDINPAMVVVSRARGTPLKSAFRAKELALHTKQRTELTIQPDDPLLSWFHPVTARAIRFWSLHFESLGDLENEALVGSKEFLQTCLFDCARQLAAPYKSKNPTWVKQPSPELRVRIESAQLRKALAQCIDARLSLCSSQVQPILPEISCASSTEIPLLSESVDAVLSSPPYCTRIDYAVTTSIELAVLGLHHQERQSLRDSTMGTSTIRRPSPSESSSKLSLFHAYAPIVNRICEHSSKSSASYYAKTIRQYFSDLAISLCEIDRCARPRASIVLVVQDSNYKDIHIDLASITIDMGNRLNWRLQRREDFEASRNMRYLNSKSRRYQPSLRSTETVLTFSKS